MKNEQGKRANEWVCWVEGKANNSDQNTIKQKKRKKGEAKLLDNWRSIPLLFFLFKL